MIRPEEADFCLSSRRHLLLHPDWALQYPAQVAFGGRRPGSNLLTREGGENARHESDFADETTGRILQVDAAPIFRTIVTELGSIGAPSQAARLCRVHVDVPTSRAGSLQAHRNAEVLAAGR